MMAAPSAAADIIGDEVSRSICMISAIDDGNQLWRTHGIAVRIPSGFGCSVTEHYLLSVREALSGDASGASRCTALFAVAPEKKRIKKSHGVRRGSYCNVDPFSLPQVNAIDASLEEIRTRRPRADCISIDASHFFYASAQSYSGIALAPLLKRPPFCIELSNAVNPVSRGETLWLARAPKALQTIEYTTQKHSALFLPAGPDGYSTGFFVKVRAVSKQCFWYDVDPLLDTEHSIDAETTGCALFRIEKNKAQLVGLRLRGKTAQNKKLEGTQISPGQWTHQAISIPAILDQLSAEAQKKEERHKRMQDQAILNEESLTDGGERLLQNRIRRELKKYAEQRSVLDDAIHESNNDVPPTIDVSHLDRGAEFLASIAVQRGLSIVISLIIDFFAAQHIEVTAELLHRAAVLIATSHSNEDCQTYLSRPHFLHVLNNAAGKQCDRKPPTRNDELYCVRPVQASATEISYENLAAAACECLAAIARQVDAQGLSILLEYLDAPCLLVRAFKNLESVATADTSFVRVAHWLHSAFRAASALARSTAHCQRFQELNLIPILDRMLPDIHALSRRGQSVASEAADTLTVWNHLRDLCGRADSRRTISAVHQQSCIWGRETNPSDAQLASFFNKNLRDDHQHITSYPKRIEVDKFYLHSQHFHTYCVKSQCTFSDGDQNNFQPLPSTEVYKLMKEELASAASS